MSAVNDDTLVPLKVNEWRILILPYFFSVFLSFPSVRDRARIVVFHHGKPHALQQQ